MNSVNDPLGEWGARYKLASSWDESTRILMLAGKQLNRLQQHLCLPEYEVKGCDAAVWMQCSLANQRVCLSGYSDGKIVRGLIHLIFEPVQHIAVTDFKAFDFDTYLKHLGLHRYLSPSRSNGVAALIQKLDECKADFDSTD